MIMPPVHEGWEGGSTTGLAITFYPALFELSGGEDLILPCRASLLPQTAPPSNFLLSGLWGKSPGGVLSSILGLTVPGQVRSRHRRWPLSLLKV